MASGSSAPLFKRKGGGGGKRDVRTREVDQASPVAELSKTDPQSTPAAADDKQRRSSPAREASDGETGASSVLAKKRRIGGLGNTLLQNSTASKRRRNNVDGDDDESDDDKWDLGNVDGDSHSSKRTHAQGNRDDATRTNDWYNEDEGAKPESKQSSAPSVNNDDGMYHGSSAYSKYVEKNDDGISSKAKAAARGPVRAGANVRVVTMFDYQPDVCKDYKETGYCGFGDTCKFLHDRSDYLAGWQLDALPNSAARQRGDLLDSDDEGARKKDEQDIPFACLICRKPFVDPIVTKCGHYFCSSCAIKRYGKSTKCFACGKQTQGIFNSATKVLDRMQRARAQKEEEKSGQRWNEGGEERTQIGGQLLEGVEVE